MPESDGTDPIAEDEILYRNIPARSGWYDPSNAPPLKDEAFTPKRHDPTGISLWRQKYKNTCEDAAVEMPQGKSYYVAVLRAGDLIANGIEVVPSPGEGGSGHASIPVLNYADRKTARVMELARLIASELCSSVEGPFPGQRQAD